MRSVGAPLADRVIPFGYGDLDNLVLAFVFRPFFASLDSLAKKEPREILEDVESAVDLMPAVSVSPEFAP
jgi:hypothetical protein